MTADEPEIDEALLLKLWRGLTERQRMVLMDRAGQSSWRYSWYVTTIKSLYRRGLVVQARTFSGNELTPQATALVEWAADKGYAVRSSEGDGWLFSAPSLPTRAPIRDRVFTLAAEGFSAGEAAKELGVSRQAIDGCRRRHNVHFLTRAELRERIAELRAQLVDREGAKSS